MSSRLRGVGSPKSNLGSELTTSAVRAAMTGEIKAPRDIFKEFMDTPRPKRSSKALYIQLKRALPEEQNLLDMIPLLSKELTAQQEDFCGALHFV